MNADIAKKWCAALRSGEYKQGKDCLRSADDTFCCLGVLCDLFQKETGAGSWRSTPDQPGLVFAADSVNYSALTLPYNVRVWAEMYSDSGVYASSVATYRCKLSVDNDAGKSFSEIADIIEANVRVL